MSTEENLLASPELHKSMGWPIRLSSVDIVFDAISFGSPKKNDKQARLTAASARMLVGRLLV
jgi:hypothetical protein